MKNLIQHLKIIQIRKFKDFISFKVCVGMFIVCLIIYYTYGVLQNGDFRGTILINVFDFSIKLDYAKAF